MNMIFNHKKELIKLRKEELFLSLIFFICLSYNVNAQNKKVLQKIEKVKTNIQVSLGEEDTPTYYKMEKITNSVKGYVKTMTCLETSRKNKRLVIETEEHSKTIEQENELKKNGKPIVFLKAPAIQYLVKIINKGDNVYIIKNDDGNIITNVRKKYKIYNSDNTDENLAYLEDISDNTRWEQCKLCDYNFSN